MYNEYRLRPATQRDAPAIRALVRGAGINPFGLDWQRFILAVDAEDRVIGCGQVKSHRDGSRELASIAVLPSWRLKGVARSIIERLLSDHSGTLYLTCRERLGKFYARFGFRTARLDEMSPYFRRLAVLPAFLQRTGIMKDGLLVMIRTVQDQQPRPHKEKPDG
jgi:amino-acid N-acetyltransferase